MGIAGSNVLIASSMCHKNLKIQADAHNCTSDKFKLWLFVASGIIYVPSNQDYDQGEESVLNLLSFIYHCTVQLVTTIATVMTDHCFIRTCFHASKIVLSCCLGVYMTPR
jgi:hypothetical protein